MSAKGRGAVVAKHEFYGTPPAPVEALLRNVALPIGTWLEPGAGDGAIIRAVNDLELRGGPVIDWAAVELQPRMARKLKDSGAKWVYTADFRRWVAPQRYEVAIGNPPFSLAESFVRHAATMADQVVMLLRLNWLGSSSKRRHLFEQLGMPDVFPLAERPSFQDDGGTDAADYAWFRWKRHGKQRGIVQILWGGGR